MTVKHTYLISANPHVQETMKGNTTMAERKQTTTTTSRRAGITPEEAQHILQQGWAQQGTQKIYVFNNTLSDLPPIKNEELDGKDFFIIRRCGDLTTEYGEATIYEVGSKSTEATRSWLVGGVSNKTGNKSVIGDNLDKYYARVGVDAFPVWVSLAWHDDGKGNPYWSLGAPQFLRQRASENESDAPVPTNALPPTHQQPADFANQARAEVAATRQVVTQSSEDLEDLPF